MVNWINMQVGANVLSQVGLKFIISISYTCRPRVENQILKLGSHPRFIQAADS
jgi:hypothetical protein